MFNKMNKDNVLLFLAIGILIVIFLNYNNFILYKNNIKTQIILNSNNKEGFSTTTSPISTLPTFKKQDTIDANQSININNDEYLNKFIQHLIPYEESPTATTNAKTANTNARYNTFKIFTKNFYDEIKNNNNINKYYKITKNEDKITKNEDKIKENVFVNNMIDLRENNLNTYNNETNNKILNMAHGLLINIDFLFNYTYPTSSNVPVRVTIEEQTKDLQIKNRTNINKYVIETLFINVLNEKEFEFKINIPSEKFDTLDNNYNHIILIKLILNKSILDISPTNTLFNNLLNSIDIYNSKLHYNVLKKDNNNDVSAEVFKFESNYLIDKLNTSSDLNEYTKNELKNLHMETLNDNYNNIISNMFNMDNKISKKEQIINDVKQHYLLNELSNMQNNMKFYNTF